MDYYPPDERKNDVTNENEIWEMAKVNLQKQLGFSEISMNLWFGSMVLKVLTEDTAYFQIENDFKQNIINTRYLDDIKKVMAEILGFEVKIVPISIEKDSFEAKLAEVITKENEQKEPYEKKAPETPAVSDKSYLTREIISNEEGTGTVTISRTSPNFLPEYTFDNFVVGNSNKTAYTSARTVAEDPAGPEFNPLFLHGDPGLGKTHLLYAITRELTAKHPDFNIIFVKGEDFMNELIEALANKTPVAFREKYRNADMLIVDDIQFIAGKASVQEEFFHTFDKLYESGKQIVLSSDRPPKDMHQLEERLRSRFESGFISDIQAPDLELRVAILKRKAQNLGINVPNDVLMYLGENIKDNVRQIEGALKKMRALAYIQGEEINMSHAKTAVNDVLTNMANAVTPAKIMSFVSSKYGIPEEDIRSSKRSKDIANARHITVYLIRKLVDMPLASIGKLLNRDHTTIMSSVENVEKQLKVSPAFENTINEMIREIKSGT
ncbi:MAG: chromosomal replication initiator protein DnaA [Ruminococcaceae bacterium]|nr:chromosomal replication initiator protein DnaA [Oscillospiraceae bacterium]